jgi:hypothetical protein
LNFPFFSLFGSFFHTLALLHSRLLLPPPSLLSLSLLPFHFSRFPIFTSVCNVSCLSSSFPPFSLPHFSCELPLPFFCAPLCAGSVFLSVGWDGAQTVATPPSPSMHSLSRALSRHPPIHRTLLHPCLCCVSPCVKLPLPNLFDRFLFRLCS